VGDVYRVLFSERYGYKPVRDTVQKESMDIELRTHLWNRVTSYYFSWSPADIFLSLSPGSHELATDVWTEFLMKPLDTFEDTWSAFYREIRERYWKFEWFEVYDFIQFLPAHFYRKEVNKDFMDVCNSVLEREMSAYRFVNGLITPLTSEEEISAIEDATNLPDEKLRPATKHLQNALAKLSDRKNPDYKNSIKESISAVESVCQLISGKKAPLSKVLKHIDEVIPIHPALQSAFITMYGYTSAEGGLRHAGDADIYFEDAKYMLVACSAFTSYLAQKAERAEIKLD
jgi:hypothetical protein